MKHKIKYSVLQLLYILGKFELMFGIFKMCSISGRKNGIIYFAAAAKCQISFSVQLDRTLKDCFIDQAPTTHVNPLRPNGNNSYHIVRISLKKRRDGSYKPRFYESVDDISKAMPQDLTGKWSRALMG